MKSKLLLVSWTVFPAVTGSAVVVSNLASGFGPDELVLAGQRPAQATTTSWSVEASEVPVHYLDVLPFGQARGQKYTRWLRLRSAVNQLRRIIADAGVTHVLAVFPDEFFCQAARLAASESQLPFSIWLHNSYLENRSGLLRQLAKVLQPRFFQSAQNVFVMSDGLGRELKKIYPHTDFIPLVHGFQVSEPPATIDVSLSPQRIRYLYSGSLNESCLDASLRMLKVIMRRPESDVHVFSGNPATFTEHGIDLAQLTVHGFLPIEEFLAELGKYDVLLLPHGIDGPRTDFEYRTIFPTRTIPLLFAGKPIFAHSPAGSYLTDFLRQHECAQLVTTKSEADLDNALTELLADQNLRQRLVQNALPAAQPFTLAHVVNKLKMQCGM